MTVLGVATSILQLAFGNPDGSGVLLPFVVSLVAATSLVLWWMISYAQSLEKKLEPRIDISLDDTHKGVRTRKTTDGHWSKWVQFVVCPSTNQALNDCEARVVKIERLLEDSTFELIENEPLLCEWSQMSHGTTRIAIPVGVRQSANLFCVQENETYLQVQLQPQQLHLRECLQNAGTFRLTVIVSANGARSRQESFRFVWGGSYEEIQIEKW